jgi:hypothetical protein
VTSEEDKLEEEEGEVEEDKEEEEVEEIEQGVGVTVESMTMVLPMESGMMDWRENLDLIKPAV